jgi:hypothetical protein
LRKEEFAVRKDSILRALKQSFQGAVPESDGRVNLSHLDFITGLIFCFLGDTKSFGLEAIRRFLIATFERPISKGAFWERLSRNRLKGILYDLMGRLMSQLSSGARIREKLMHELGVSALYLVDSSSITLWDGACESYPGTRTHAAIKWHACFDLLSGHMTWFGITAASVNDRKCFPDIQSLAGKLILFDRGYWDYGLLMMIEAAKGFFLSRIKSNAAIGITKVIHGLSTAAVGSKLSALTFKRKRKEIIELLGEVVHKGQAKVYRVIGFWNPVEKQYHWYLTNLSVAAYLLYPLYRLRWQVAVSSEGHILQSVEVRPRLKDSGLVAWEAPWRESKTAEPSDNVLEIEYRQSTRLQRAVNAGVASLHAIPVAERVYNVRRQQGLAK